MYGVVKRACGKVEASRHGLSFLCYITTVAAREERTGSHPYVTRSDDVNVRVDTEDFEDDALADSLHNYRSRKQRSSVLESFSPKVLTNAFNQELKQRKIP